MAHKSKAFPRRRDVRTACENVLKVLQKYSFCGEFDNTFLTVVRDYMCEGLSFVEAVETFLIPQSVEY